MSTHQELPPGGYAIRPIAPYGPATGREHANEPGKMGQFALAPWGRRLGAVGIDWTGTVVAPLWVGSAIFGGGGGGFALMAVLVLANSVVMQGLSGQSFGKYLLGLTLVRPVEITGEAVPYHLVYPGLGTCFARLIWHILDLILLYGLARCAWHPYRQMVADSHMSTLVIGDPIVPFHGDGWPML